MAPGIPPNSAQGAFIASCLSFSFPREFVYVVAARRLAFPIDRVLSWHFVYNIWPRKLNMISRFLSEKSSQRKFVGKKLCFATHAPLSMINVIHYGEAEHPVLRDITQDFSLPIAHIIESLFRIAI